MSHSNSSINAFCSCQRSYLYNYIQHAKPCKAPSVHLTFGTMAHEVLLKAGILRDDQQYVSDYQQVIPSEILYLNEKEYFKISSWNLYFTHVIKQVAQYEDDIVSEMLVRCGNGVKIKREYKMSLSPQQIGEEYPNTPELRDNFVGVIDLLVLSEDNQYATIVDYKFSTKAKTQEDFDMNSQLYAYALMVHCEFGTPLRNIQIAYIDIPKTEFAMPKLLQNGTLSRSKEQNVSQALYLEAIKICHPDDWKSMTEPGGYYYDILNELSLKKAAYLQKQWLDTDIYQNIIGQLVLTMYVMDELNSKDDSYYVGKFDARECKDCAFVNVCKPYLYINKGE